MVTINLTLRSTIIILTYIISLATPSNPILAENSTPLRSERVALNRTHLINSLEPQSSQYRGWDYLVQRLIDNGVSKEVAQAIYTDPRLPQRTFVPFSIKPREPSSIYSGFNHPRHVQIGADFIRRNKSDFARLEQQLLVPREVVAAIIVIESGAGRNTGTHLLIYRLSRLATTNSPDNLRANFLEQRERDPLVTYDDVKRRGGYLERTFLPEIPALLEISRRNQVDIFDMRGSSAGAFGLPQFLPSAFLRFGVDGDRNGIVSLNSECDAIWSAGNYLASFGFRKDIPLQEKRAIIWRYNKSASYIDTVLQLGERIRKAM
jgi:membrane-bound lytic murein transglycosylase B